jgi:hypothetical protein
MMQTDVMPKDKMFKLRLDDVERERLDAVAAHYALNVAGVIRMLVKREADAIAASAPVISKGVKPRKAKKSTSKR